MILHRFLYSMSSKTSHQESKLVVESDHQFLWNCQIKKENLEINSNLKDHELLSVKFIELEKHYSTLEEEKKVTESAFLNKEKEQRLIIEDLLSEIMRSRKALNERQIEIIEIKSSISAHSDLLRIKNAEIDELTRSFQATNLMTQNIRSNINNLTNELEVEKESKFTILGNLDKSRYYNNSLFLERRMQEEKIKKYELELGQNCKKLNHAVDENKLLSAEKRNLEADVGLQKEARYNIQKEVERMVLLNTKLLDDKRALELKARELEGFIITLDGKIKNTINLIHLKEKEIQDAKNSINYTEVKNFEALEQLRKLNKEKETFELLMNQYKKDADLNKKLRDDKAMKALELERQKKKLESIYSSKEMEALIAKKDLEKVGTSHLKLKEDNLYLNQELDALKNHASVLENQNFSLHNEIDNIVRTDGIIRNELDRKSRFEYMKSKNLEQLQKSSEKVRLSRSPKKI